MELPSRSADISSSTLAINVRRRCGYKVAHKRCHAASAICNMKIDTRPVFVLLLLLAAAMQMAACAHNLEEEYRFSAALEDGYKLHWNFDLEQQTIAFAVNVSTTGWVGFGLSPNGQMPQSDVVIGWVDNDGTTSFHVK